MEVELILREIRAMVEWKVGDVLLLDVLARLCLVLINSHRIVLCNMRENHGKGIGSC